MQGVIIEGMANGTSEQAGGHVDGTRTRRRGGEGSNESRVRRDGGSDELCGRLLLSAAMHPVRVLRAGGRLLLDEPERFNLLENLAGHVED